MSPATLLLASFAQKPKTNRGSSIIKMDNAMTDIHFDLGERLRTVRKKHGLSQREIAKRTGITNSTISLIEKNRISPSVASLKKILGGLPMSLSAFFGGDSLPDEKIFYSAGELIELASSGISIRQVGANLEGRKLQINHERYAPGADTGVEMLNHVGEEGGIVVRGQIELSVGGKSKKLEEGDAYYFSSGLPHRFRNLGTEECEIVSAVTPPTF